MKLLIAASTLLVIVGGLWYLSGSSQKSIGERTNRELALLCDDEMADGFHIHPVLEIVVNGERVSIPPNIGIQKTCMTALHTHTPDGLIHVESPEKRDFTLADFFAVWNQPSARRQY